MHAALLLNLESGEGCLPVWLAEIRSSVRCCNVPIVPTTWSPRLFRQLGASYSLNECRTSFLEFDRCNRRLRYASLARPTLKDVSSAEWEMHRLTPYFFDPCRRRKVCSLHRLVGVTAQCMSVVNLEQHFYKTGQASFRLL